MEPASCLSCPSNSFSPANSFTITACECNAGYVGANGAPCLACVAGKYKVSTGSEGCIDCPAFSNSAVASNELVDCICNAGSTGPDGSTCTQCEAGTYKVATGSAVCTNCPITTYSTSVGATSNVCQGCLSHASSLIGSTSESDCFCNSGFYRTSTGICVECAVGKYRLVT